MPLIKLNDDNFIPYTQSMILKNSSAVDYLKNRKVIANQLKEFNIGFSGTGFSYKGVDVYSSRLTFPMIDEYGKVIGVLSRSIKKDDTRYLKGLFDSSKEGFLFGINTAVEEMYRTKTVLLVEGVFDLIAVRPYFKSSLAMLTSGLSFSQKDVLDRYIRTIIYVPDNDEAGQNSFENLKKFCSSRYEIVKVDYNYKDLSEWLSKDKDSFSGYFKDLSSAFF